MEILYFVLIIVVVVLVLMYRRKPTKTDIIPNDPPTVDDSELFNAIIEIQADQGIVILPSDVVEPVIEPVEPVVKPTPTKKPTQPKDNVPTAKKKPARKPRAKK